MMTNTHVTAPRLPLTRTTTRGPLGVVLNALAIWRERQKLSRLDDAMLRDIGKSREAAITEARRAVWDAPSRWFL